MSTKITDTEMSSDVTRHTAGATVDCWAVTCLPGRTLTRDQAVTAMTIQSASGSTLPAEPGPEAAAALVEAMDGGERTLLLNHIAQAHPDVVTAGVEWLAEWRAECAERRRKAGRRREHDRRRRRAELTCLPGS